MTSGAVRPIGDFSLFETGSAQLAHLVAQLDTERLTIVYVRKSDPKAHKEHAAYLMVQEALPYMLIEAGVPKDRLILLEGDTGKSAWLSRKFRQDLSELYERIGAEQVGTVVVRDISRMFRDAWLKEPADFAARMARFSTRILTTFGGEWVLLNLRRDADREQFMRGAKEAASYRKSWRAQSMASREMSALQGNFTGGPAPFGYGIRAGVAAYEAKDGIARSPRPFVYEPHAELKLRIMEMSLEPHIQGYSTLRRHLIANNVVVPPFDPDTAKESFPRSLLSRIWTIKNGERAYMKADESFVPSRRMLEGILLDPLAIGIRLYGSGDSGKYALMKHTRLADEMDMPPDSMIRPDKVYVGEFPELAICRTEEQIALFWAVAEKWSRTDLRTAIGTKYRERVPNAAQYAGKPQVDNAGNRQRRNPWGVRVFCLKHGRDETGHPDRSHSMALHNSRTSWDCYRDQKQDLRYGACSAWASENLVGRILDMHLKRGILAALEGKTAIIRTLTDDREERKQSIARLRVEAEELSREKERLLDQADAYRRSLEGFDREFIEVELDKFHRDRLRPVLSSFAEKSRDLERAEAAGLANAGTPSEREVRTILRRIVEQWDSLPTEEKAFAVSTFVRYVGILIGDGFETKVGLIEFAWNDGVTDYLVGFRGPYPDLRPWLPEEDETIRTLWPSTCSWEELRARIQPRRTFRRVRARARELGVSKGAKRSNIWIFANLEADKSWGERHPDVLYLQLHPKSARWCLAVKHDGSAEVIETPEEVTYGVAVHEKFIVPLEDKCWM